MKTAVEEMLRCQPGIMLSPLVFRKSLSSWYVKIFCMFGEDRRVIISKPVNGKTNKRILVGSYDSDQTGRLPVLIRACAVRVKKLWDISHIMNAEQRLSSNWIDVQVDWSTKWHRPSGWFCHVVAWIWNYFSSIYRMMWFRQPIATQVFDFQPYHAKMLGNIWLCGHCIATWYAMSQSLVKLT